MNGLTKWPKVLIIIGAVVFIFGAFVHLYFGYPSISNDLSQLDASPLVSALLKAMWILFALHWLILGGLLLVWVFHDRPATFVAMFCGLISIVDGVVLGTFAGPANMFWAVPGIIIILGCVMLMRQPTVPVENIGVKSFVD